MDTTSVEFGLVNTFKTGNLYLDTLICMLIPLFIRYVFTNAGPSTTSLWLQIKQALFGARASLYVTRSIELTQHFNQYGKVRDWDQKNHLLQKALAIYLSHVLSLVGRDARYELLEKTKPPQKKKALATTEESEWESGTGSTSSSTPSDTVSEYESDEDFSDYDEDDDDSYCGEINRLSVGALPPLNTWVPVKPGLQFMHEVKNEGDEGGDNDGKQSKSLSKSRVIFHFRSDDLVNGSHKIDDFINVAFARYQAIERRKYMSDKARYMYFRMKSYTTSTSSGGDASASSAAVKYKRYALGEEKTFSNLFFKEKPQVLQLLDNFKNRTGKFSIKGFPYKLGMLLHGPPGTGKTSLIKAIAQYTQRHVVSISLSKIETNQELMDTMFDLRLAVESLDLPVKLGFKDVVFVMEDIDCASTVVMTRKKTKKEAVVDKAVDEDLVQISGGKDASSSSSTSTEASSDLLAAKLLSLDDSTEMASIIGPQKKKSVWEMPDALNLSGLLNVLDGVIDCPGRIVIMTTNHPEKLDPALIRPGRVNKKLFLGYMGVVEVQQMIEYYFSQSLSSKQQTQLQQTFALAEEKKKTFTPAEIEEFCAEYEEVSELLEQMESQVQALEVSS